MFEKIIIVDDEPGTFELCQGILERDKYEVITLLSYDNRLLEKIEDHAADLVLCNYKMRGTNGLTLCRQIKAMGLTAVVIKTSHYNEIEFITGALVSGVDEVLPVPSSLRELRSVIRRILRQKQA